MKVARKKIDGKHTVRSYTKGAKLYKQIISSTTPIVVKNEEPPLYSEIEKATSLREDRVYWYVPHNVSPRSQSSFVTASGKECCLLSVVAVEIFKKMIEPLNIDVFDEW